MTILPEFTNFRIHKIITHEIFQRNEQREIVSPDLSDSLTILNTAGISQLETRIVEAIGQDSKSVEMYIENIRTDSVFNQVNTITNNNNDNTFIDYSKNIANNLARAQSTRNLPGGILVIISGTTGIGNNKYVAIIKAELQGGFQKAVNRTIEYVKDLLLTPQQKLYKIGIFMKSTGAPNNFRSFVYDHNMSRSEENGMAAYFYDAFLGCKILHTDKYFTNKFYHETKSFIDDSTLFTDDEKFDLHTHLYSYLKSESNTINITEFADQYISETAKRDIYREHMQNVIEEGFNRSITKNISDIKGKLRMRKVTFSNKVKISAPSDEFENNVKIIEEIEDREGNIITTVNIAGKVSSLDR